MSRLKWTLRPMSNTYHILSVNDFCKPSSLSRYNIGGQSPALPERYEINRYSRSSMHFQNLSRGTTGGDSWAIRWLLNVCDLDAPPRPVT